MELVCATDESGGVTLVECVLHNNTRTARAVTIENHLEGTVLEPREHGAPAGDWSEGALTVQLSAGDRLGIGYACRAAPREPPAAIVHSEPIDQVPSTRSPSDVMTALGDPRPPENAIAGSGRRGSTRAPGNPPDPESDREADCSPTKQTEDHHEDPQDWESDVPTGNAPPAIEAWLRSIETRLEADEQIDRAALTAVAAHATSLAERVEQ
ncbi:MAG: hypothetical protein ABEJ35_03100 [Halobacteriaceae archaeon]